MNADLKEIVEKAKIGTTEESSFATYNREVHLFHQNLYRQILDGLKDPVKNRPTLEARARQGETFSKDAYKESIPIWTSAITANTAEKEKGRSATT